MGIVLATGYSSSPPPRTAVKLMTDHIQLEKKQFQFYRCTTVRSGKIQENYILVPGFAMVNISNTYMNFMGTGNTFTKLRPKTRINVKVLDRQVSLIVIAEQTLLVFSKWWRCYKIIIFSLENEAVCPLCFGKLPVWTRGPEMQHNQRNTPIFMKKTIPKNGQSTIGILMRFLEGWCFFQNTRHSFLL